MTTPITALLAQRRQSRDPAERAAIADVIDDAHIEAGRPSSSRRVRGCDVALIDPAAAVDVAAAHTDAAYASDEVSEAAYAYDAVDAAYHDTVTPSEWIDMTPGLYILQWRGTYDRAVTAIAYCRVDGDWVHVAPGHRTMWTSGSRALTDVAVTGLLGDYTLGEPSQVPRWLPVGAVSAIGPLSPDVWSAHVARAEVAP